MSDPNPIGILLVDDHEVVRQGLIYLFASSPDLEVIGEATTGREAVAAYGELRPDVVLMDLRMPDVDGVEAIAEITARHPDARVLVLTTYDADADILRAVEAGAAGYLLKDAKRLELFEAVRAANRGETVLAPSVAARLVARTRAPAHATVSRRELDVLALVQRGHTNADIGRVLHISEATVKTHLARAFSKLAVDDRTAAVTVATERGLLPPV